MNILWFIPFYKKNAVGKNSESVAMELSKYSDIENNFLQPLYSLTDLISKELSSMGVSLDMHICETIANDIDFLYRYK